MIRKLETDRLLLRPFELSDANKVQLLAGDKEVASTTLAIPHPYPDGAADQWIEAARQAAENGDRYAFAVVRKEDEELVGNMSIGIARHHNRAELAYWIGKPYWGQGYATEAARRMVQFGFEELELNRIHAAAMTKNPASYKVMINVGMKYEGTFPQHIMKWGQYEDLVFYGMIRTDLPKQMTFFI
ncbi:GNAT family N-acetyltransferase [Paenibacillus harenae]|uniref:GNAT family N-acetyltransferase n=1 Tax=Paenibacillus harenae TaxID=306543 RepID=UPI002794F984|nr:GNAT family N-acetyltransferase [Paenibacillus harenae]MDQ0062659.1 RimJ/RimL family protein N-acetyltransferase [Paenibacillus harenae]